MIRRKGWEPGGCLPACLELARSRSRERYRALFACRVSHSGGRFPPRVSFKGLALAPELVSFSRALPRWSLQITERQCLSAAELSDDLAGGHPHRSPPEPPAVGRQAAVQSAAAPGSKRLGARGPRHQAAPQPQVNHLFYFTLKLLCLPLDFLLFAQFYFATFALISLRQVELLDGIFFCMILLPV